MTPLILHPSKWNDYSLIDSGYGQKLERFGPYMFARPEPQALWPQNLSQKIWYNAAGTFLSSSSMARLFFSRPQRTRSRASSRSDISTASLFFIAAKIAASLMTAASSAPEKPAVALAIRFMSTCQGCGGMDTKGLNLPTTV